MSTKLVTNHLNLHNAKQFRESISETANSIYYVFAGRHTPYVGGDESIPDLVNTNDTVNIDPSSLETIGTAAAFLPSPIILISGGMHL